MTDLASSASQPPFTLAQIAALVGGTVLGDPEARLTGVASVEEAEAGDLVFAESTRYLSAALHSRAAAIITSSESELAETPPPKPLILVSDPRLAFVQALEAFAPRRTTPVGIHPAAQISAQAHLGAEVSVGAYVTVSAHVTLGDRVELWPGVFIGEGCVIGDDTVIYPNAVLYPRVTVGSRCILHAGCVIGADGFGFILVGASLRKVPQLGVVEIGDEVEVGANTCIDRAKTGATVIGSGTKLDNLVQIAHNVRTGQSCIIISQVGIAGSVTLGNGVILAGQVGVRDHISLGDGAQVAAQSGVRVDVEAGEKVSGYPARPYAQNLREWASVAALPDTVKHIRTLEKRIAALEAQLPGREEEA
jgi:UDP-3-O-[3-hydroxymyristoyl] glucosamine N-acyltransferase